MSFQPSMRASGEKRPWVDGLVRKIYRSLTNVSPKKDTAYILMSPLPWSFTLDNTMITTGFKYHSDIDVTEYQPGDLAFVNGTTI